MLTHGSAPDSGKLSVSPALIHAPPQLTPVGKLGLSYQLPHVGHRVRVLIQVLFRFPGLQFDLQTDAIGVMEVEGLPIAPLDDISHLYPVVLETLVGLVELGFGGYGESEMVQELRGPLGGTSAPSKTANALPPPISTL
jgi:hypothetical protein